MFDRHQAEITVMQFTGHSLPVHQYMTVPWDFTLSHIVSQACLCEWNMQLLRLWNGMSGRVEGQYTTIARHDDDDDLMQFDLYINIVLIMYIFCAKILFF